MVRENAPREEKPGPAEGREGKPWRPSLKKNIVYNAFGQSFLLLLQIFTIKNIFTGLGHNIFGIIAFCQLVSFLITTFFDKTTRFSLVKEIAQSGGGADSMPFVRSFGLMMWLTFLLLAGLILYGAPLVANHWINLGTLDPKTAVFVIRVLGTVAAAAVLKSFLTSIVMGLQRHGYYNLLESISQATLQIGLIASIKITQSLDGVLYWYLLHTALALGAYAFLCGRLFDPSCLLPSLDLAPLKKSLGFNTNIMLSSLLGVLQKRFDTIILSKLLPVSEMGFYSTIFNFAAKANLPAVAIGQAAYPSLSSLVATGDPESLRAKYRVVNDAAIVASMLATGFLIFASKPLLAFIFGPETSTRLLPAFNMILGGFLLSSMVSVPWIVSLATGKPGITTASNFISLSFIPFSFWLISLFHLNGAGVSWMVYNLLYCVFAIPKICRQCLAMPAWPWFKNIGIYALGLLSTYGIPWYWLFHSQRDSLVLLGLVFTGSTAAFGAYVHLFALSSESKMAFKPLKKRIASTFREARA